MNNTPDSPAKPPDDRMDQGGNYWPLFTPGIWKDLHAVLQSLVLHGLTAIGGGDPDIERGASGGCCHDGNISRIGHPSITKNLGLSLAVGSGRSMASF
jgi:hypothetical protein